MKINQIFILVVLLFAGNLCCAQGNLNKSQLTVVDYKPGSKAALLVLHVGNRRLVPAQGAAVKLQSFKTRWVQSISVLKGEDATGAYGEKGRNGVIVVTFKDYDLVPKTLQSKFIELW